MSTINGDYAFIKAVICIRCTGYLYRRSPGAGTGLGLRRPVRLRLVLESKKSCLAEQKAVNLSERLEWDQFSRDNWQQWRV